MTRAGSAGTRIRSAGRVCRLRFRCLALATALVAAAPGGGHAHTVGLGEQVLQPLANVHTALPLLACTLMLRQQGVRHATRGLGIALSCGLLAGLALWLFGGQSAHWPVAGLITAIVIGCVVAWGPMLAPPIRLAAVAAVGLALGVSLLTETHDAIDFATSLAGSFAGTLVVLEVGVSVPRVLPRWQAIGERIAGSWVTAIAMLIAALSASRMM